MIEYDNKCVTAMKKPDMTANAIIPGFSCVGWGVGFEAQTFPSTTAFVACFSCDCVTGHTITSLP